MLAGPGKHTEVETCLPEVYCGELLASIPVEVRRKPPGAEGGIETVTGSCGTGMVLWDGPELRQEAWPFYHYIDQALDTDCAQAVGVALGEERARLWRVIELVNVVTYQDSQQLGE